MQESEMGSCDLTYRTSELSRNYADNRGFACEGLHAIPIWTCLQNRFHAWSVRIPTRLMLRSWMRA